MKLYVFDFDTLIYKDFKFWKWKHLFILILIIIATSITSIFLYNKFFETNREKSLKEDIRYLMVDYNKINKRNIEAEIILSKMHPNDSTIKTLDKILPCIPSITPIEKKYIKRIRPYGNRIHPVYGNKDFHSGMDFSGKKGNPVLATGNGIIESAVNSSNGYGNHIIIDHGFGYKTLYGHLSKYNVKKDQEVIRGDTIGFVGNTGTSTGSHLHYEVIKDGKKINPINYFFNDIDSIK